MPPRPFPQTLSIGIDICHYLRFLKYFPTHHHFNNPKNKPNDATTTISSPPPLFKLLDKTFLPSEQRVFWRKFRPRSASPSSLPGTSETFGTWTPQQANEAARYIASRWAAKEAVIKAFASERRLMLRDVEIRKDVKTKQPLGVVSDEGGEGKKYENAEKVFGKLRRRWEVRDELEMLQRGGAAAGAPDKGLRIIKEPSLTRHTARRSEDKEDLPRQEPTSEEETAAAPAPISNSNPSILSDKGILDLNTVTKLLEQEPQQPSSSPSPSPPSTTPSQSQSQPDQPTTPQVPAEQQTKQTQLEEEMKQLRKQEQAEDAWNNLEGQVVKVSISHDGEYCVATALAAV
ncbi:hypothetical protein KCU65_g2373, partial [Aureobasidium melanogenum]